MDSSNTDGAISINREWQLGIDTCGIVSHVGISTAYGQSHSAVVGDGQSHNESLALAVQQMTSNSSFDFNDLKFVVVGSGPGSFTGLRIGFAFAKAIATSKSIPFAVASSFLSFAWEFRKVAPLICVVGDARRSEYFYEIFGAGPSGEFGSLHPIAIASREIIESTCAELASLKSVQSTDILFVPTSFRLASHAQGEHSAEETSWGIESSATNVGASLIELALLGRATFYNTIQEIALAEPVYLREVAAQTIIERNKAKMVV